jgi:sulfite reductase alpha subunit-like flavoprotein
MKKLSPTATMWIVFSGGLLAVIALALLLSGSEKTLAKLHHEQATLIHHKRTICRHATETHLLTYDDDIPSAALIAKLPLYNMRCISPVSRQNAADLIEQLKTQSSWKWINSLVRLNGIASEYLAQLEQEARQP